MIKGSSRRAVPASGSELAKYGATLRQGSTGEPDIFEHRGFKITSFHTNIIDSSTSADVQDRMYDRLSLPRPGGADEPVNGPNLRLPPMIFGHDIMRIEMDDEGGKSFDLSLVAEDALTLWAAQHTSENLSKHPLSVIQVPYAAIWSKLNGPASALSHGEAKEAPQSPASPDSKKQRDEDASSGGSPVHIDRRSPLWDWTFSSDYCCTLGKRGAPRQHIVGMKELFSPATQGPVVGDDENLVALVQSVREAPTSGIEYELLRANDVPILFYDEILLYQDDLEDCGEVVFEAKLRVMPHCWFILSRMFLRVDGVMLRIRDSRFFHRFGSDAVHLEVSWKECKLALKVDKDKGQEGGELALSAGGGEAKSAQPPPAPPASPGHLHIDGSALRDINKLAQIVPVVATRNFTLTL